MPASAPRGASGARYRRILLFAARLLIIEWWCEFALPRVGLGGLARRRQTERFRRFAREFHGLARDLGGLMIKVGQLMSSRLDILPPEVTAELAGLQDEVPPVPFEAVRAVTEAELGMPLERAFAWVDPVPLAAASLGQAHRARLTPALAAEAGFTDVVVKVQRPGIEQVVAVDLAALRRIAGWLARIGFVARRVDAPRLVEEFGATSLEELDYRREAAATVEFAELFAGDARVTVPGVAWERSTERVLTLQDVTAIKVSDVSALRAAGIDPSEVAHELARVTFVQLFSAGFFHADPHPGNVFVTPAPDGWRFTFIDFGMMGRLPEELRQGLVDVAVAVVRQDAAAMTAAAQRTGVLLPGADLGEVERVMAGLFARFGGMAVQDVAATDPRELRAFADEFGEALRAMPVQLPENFLLLIRATSIVSGVCTALDARFNMWEALAPFVDELVRREGGALVRRLADEALTAAATLARLPGRADALITRIDRGELRVRTPDVDRQLLGVQRTLHGLTAAIVFAALMLAGAMVYAGDHPLGIGLMCASAAPLLLSLARGDHRRGR